MKLCKDCKHFRGALAIFSMYAPAACKYPALMRIEPVYGDSVYKSSAVPSPEYQREHGECGIDAAWFEPKATA